MAGRSCWVFLAAFSAGSFASAVATADDQAELENLPVVDISQQTQRHVIVAAGTEQVYQGHPHTLLLPDGKTIYCVWTLIHGHGAPRMKRSDDGGRTWSKLLPLPEGWAPYGHCPTLHRIIGPDKKERLLLMDRTGRTINFAQAVSGDNGKTWTEMRPTGLSGIVAPMSIISVESSKKHLMWTHRGAGDKDRSPLAVWQAESTNGGLTWKNFHKVCEVPGKDPCEPFAFRSPGGKELCCLMRENTHKGRSLMMFSTDEGRTWSTPQDTPWGLTGDRHVGVYAPDGRLVIAFRDKAHGSSTRNHFVAWVGTYDDIRHSRTGQYRIKLLHSHAGGDCGYPGMELLPDGTIVATTYIKYQPGKKKHSVVSTRFTLKETDALVPQAEAQRKAREAREAARRKLLAERTIDSIAIGDKAAESKHNLQGSRSQAGTHGGKGWRHATGGGWFIYDLKVLPDQPASPHHPVLS